LTRLVGSVAKVYKRSRPAVLLWLESNKPGGMEGTQDVHRTC
jgi:hypothetical protein